jgi:hypothetical protein
LYVALRIRAIRMFAEQFFFFFAVLYLGLFAACLFSVYSIAPYVMVFTSATVMNLSLLTSDVYAILASVFMFHLVVSARCTYCVFTCTSYY